MQQQHQQQQSTNPQQQQLQQHVLSNQQPQTSNHSMHQLDKVGGGSGSVAVDGSMSNSFRGNDQVSSLLVSSASSIFWHLIYQIFSPSGIKNHWVNLFLVTR